MTYIEEITLKKQRTELAPEMEQVCEKLAKSTHDEWAGERISQGWTYGPEQDDVRKKHPCLVPYEQLSMDEKKFNVETARETIRRLLAAGAKITL